MTKFYALNSKLYLADFGGIPGVTFIISTSKIDAPYIPSKVPALFANAGCNSLEIVSSKLPPSWVFWKASEPAL